MWGIVILIVIHIPFLYLGALFASRTAWFEGRVNGQRFSVAFSQVNDRGLEIADACRVVPLNPRILGSCIFAERCLNYLPVFEESMSMLFGNSVGFSQVNLRALSGALNSLWNPTSRDSLFFIKGKEGRWGRLYEYFASCKELRAWQLKWKLELDDRFNITSAGLILWMTLERYRLSDGGVDATSNAAIAGTLFHVSFPRTITQRPDKFGLAADSAYRRMDFMPHSLIASP